MLSQSAIVHRPHPTRVNPPEMMMPFTLTVRISGFSGLPEENIMQLERKLTEFFFQAPQRVNGFLTVYLDMYGDMHSIQQRIQLFMFGLRGAVTPYLAFDVSFYFGVN